MAVDSAQMLVCRQKVKTEISDVGDMDEEHRVFQLEEFVEQENRDYGSDGVGDEGEHSTGGSFLVVEKMVDIAAVVRGFEVFGSVGRDIGWYWTRRACAGTATEYCTIVLESANHSEEVLESVEVEEVGLDRYPDMQ
jgi:hypothetical protein